MNNGFSQRCVAGLARLCPPIWPSRVLALVVLTGLSACGGGDTAGQPPGGALYGVDALPVLGEQGAARVLPQITADFGGASRDPGSVSGGSVGSSVTATGTTALSTPSLSTTEVALSAPDPGRLLLLLPDAQDPQDARVQAWLDAGRELGVRLQPVSDSVFMQMGTAALGHAGLVLPDSLHVQASDALIAAVRQYTEQGGKTLLVFDFGALTLQGDVPVYPVPRSRLSDLAGVDYVLYDTLRERTTGLGPVLATRSTLRTLLVPPGKSMPLEGASPLLSSQASAPQTSATGGSLLEAAGVSASRALYLPVSPQDPGGVLGFDPQQYSQLRYFSRASTQADSPGPRQVRIDMGRAQRGAPWTQTSRLSPAQPLRMGEASVSPSADAGLPADPEEAWSGYLLGPLVYPSYVTQGDFGQQPGQRVLARSPQFGLVAGLNPVGAGQVLFVNLPLTYLKGRTDALMMHGFLHLFTREVLALPHLSPMPNGVAGMTLDWHLDALEAQAPTQKLIKLNVFNDPAALFSIEMTAGPDTIVPGDGLGWNLPGNKKAQQWLRSFVAAGHAVGSHGGWIHDYYGTRVSETNRLDSTGGACLHSVLQLDNYEQCLVLNSLAVDKATGRTALGYSAPEGNNPLWAMDWLARRGVVAAYFGGHTGLGMTRQYREGQLLNPTMWMAPVTPMGLYATFEEFQAYGVPKAEVTAWYRALVEFNIAQNTSRLVYAHPAGAAQWSDVLLDLLRHAKAQSPRLSWYTTVRLAQFMAERQDVVWQQTLDADSGKTVFTASHPRSLAEMTWRLPRSRYPQVPELRSGSAQIDGSDSRYWQLRATGGTQLVFAL